MNILSGIKFVSKINESFASVNKKKNTKRNSKRRSKASKKISKKSKGLVNLPESQADLQNILKPEKYTYGKCGKAFGFCNGNRYCNNDGQCGPESTHKTKIEHENTQYRLCVGRDTNCIRNAICSADLNNDIKCRIVLA